MNSLVALAAAGGLGAASRFVLDGLISRHSRLGVPVGTLVINVLGSLLLGVLAGWASTHGMPTWGAAAGTGFLGGFTTFSTASVELVRLVDARRAPAAFGLAVSMLLVGVGAAAAGYAIAAG